MSLLDMKVSEIDVIKKVEGFIAIAEMGINKKEEVLKNLDVVNEELDSLNSEIASLQAAGEELEKAKESGDSGLYTALEKEYGTEDEIHEEYLEVTARRNRIAALMVKLEDLLKSHRNFNKEILFSNIRYLLKEKPEVKIGQIEKEAGVRLGYTSRLEKPDNTSDPSMEFVVTAARLLGVGVDTMISVDLAALTPTEEYLIKFFNKMIQDTLKDKLDWVRETAFELNGLEPDYNGYIPHPLFEEKTYWEEGETDYPDQVTRIVFSSKSFGPKTYIAGDCFHLRMKNGTTLFLMDIEKSVHSTKDASAFVKEGWIYVPGRETIQPLVTTKDENPIVPTFEELFKIVKNRMEHPKINKDIKYAIDSFMVDDLEDDPEELPFN